jgi:putative membrane protein
MRFTMRGVAVVALLGVFAAFVGAEDRKEGRKDKEVIDDATFVMKAGSSNLAEIKASELAQKEATSGDIREFSAMLVKDHSNAQSALKRAAKSAGVTVPSELLPEHKKGGEMLAKHQGEKDFDTAFIKHMVESHTKSVELYESASASVKNDELKKYIEKTLPVVKEHLATAKKLAKVTNTKDGGKEKSR